MKKVAFIGIETPTVFGILSKKKREKKIKVSLVCGINFDTMRTPPSYLLRWWLLEERFKLLKRCPGNDASKKDIDDNEPEILLS